MEIEINKFKHSVKGQVRFNEVDMFNVVHNVQYFNYFEWARIKYFETLGFNMTANAFMKDNLFMVVHQEADFLNSLRFFDEFEILTRTINIGDKSLTIENVILNKQGLIMAIGKVVFVNLNPKTMISENISEAVKKQIINLEGEL